MVTNNFSLSLNEHGKYNVSTKRNKIENTANMSTLVRVALSLMLAHLIVSSDPSPTELCTHHSQTASLNRS